MTNKVFDRAFLAAGHRILEGMGLLLARVQNTADHELTRHDVGSHSSNDLGMPYDDQVGA